MSLPKLPKRVTPAVRAVIFVEDDNAAIEEALNAYGIAVLRGIRATNEDRQDSLDRGGVFTPHSNDNATLGAYYDGPSPDDDDTVVHLAATQDDETRVHVILGSHRREFQDALRKISAYAYVFETDIGKVDKTRDPNNLLKKTVTLRVPPQSLIIIHPRLFRAIEDRNSSLIFWMDEETEEEEKTKKKDADGNDADVNDDKNEKEEATQQQEEREQRDQQKMRREEEEESREERAQEEREPLEGEKEEQRRRHQERMLSVPPPTRERALRSKRVLGFQTFSERLTAYVDNDNDRDDNVATALRVFGLAVVRHPPPASVGVAREYELPPSSSLQRSEGTALDMVRATTHALTARVVVRSHGDRTTEAPPPLARSELIDVPQGWTLLMNPFLWRSAPPPISIDDDDDDGSEQQEHATAATAWIVTPLADAKLRNTAPADLVSLGSFGIVCNFYHQAVATKHRMVQHLEAVAYGSPTYLEMVHTIWNGDADNNPHAEAQRRVGATLDNPVYAAYDTRHHRWVDGQSLKADDPPRTAGTALVQGRLRFRILPVPEFWPYHSERTPVLQCALFQQHGCVGEWYYDVSKSTGRFRFSRDARLPSDNDDNAGGVGGGGGSGGRGEVSFELPATTIGWYPFDLEPPPWGHKTQPPNLSSLRRWLIEWRGQEDGSALLLRYGILYPTTRADAVRWLDDPDRFIGTFAEVDAQPWSAVTWPGGDEPPTELSEKEVRDQHLWDEYREHARRERERHRLREDEEKRYQEALARQRDEHHQQLEEERQRLAEERKERETEELRRQAEEVLAQERAIEEDRKRAREERKRETKSGGTGKLAQRLELAQQMEEYERETFGPDAPHINPADISPRILEGLYKHYGDQQQEQQQEEQQQEQQQEEQQHQEQQQEEQSIQSSDDDNDGDSAADSEDEFLPCADWLGWDLNDNSCFIDSALMVALAPGTHNPLRDALLTPNENDTDDQTALRTALRKEWDAVRQVEEVITCIELRHLMAQMAPSRRDMLVGGGFEEAHEVVQLLHELLIGQNHRLCEERQRIVVQRDYQIERRALPAWPIFEARALLLNEEEENDDILSDYTTHAGRQERRQSLQLLVNRDNDFTVTQNLDLDGVTRIAVQKALSMSPRPFEYVVIYLNRQRYVRKEHVIQRGKKKGETRVTVSTPITTQPVVFPRVLSLRTVNGTCPPTSGAPLQADRVDQTRFVLMAVAAFQREHWTMAFRCDGPIVGEDRLPLEPESDEDRWFYYDDNSREGVVPIAHNYNELLHWSPSKRSHDYLQKTGAVFYYVRPPASHL